MIRNKVNTYNKALRHLKSTQIDEKIQLLSEVPTNSTSGIYVIEPESIVQDPDETVLEGEVDFTQDALANGRDTTGLFGIDNTTILTIEPPGDTTYVLGPMASMWYSWGNFSTIGYIRQSDRRMVDLGRISGQLGSWNGVNGFTSYGQLTLAQAVWFRDTPKLNGASNNTPNYRAFYPGPPSNSPDQYGRYLCVITGTPKVTTVTPPPRRVPPVVGNPNQAGYPWPNDPPSPPDPYGDLAILLGSVLLAKALIVALGTAGAWALARSANSLNKVLEWYNRGRNVRIPDENNARWRDLIRDDLKQRGQSDASFARGDKPPIFGRPDQAFNPFRSADKGGPGSGPTPLGRQLGERSFRAIIKLFQPTTMEEEKSYELEGKVFSGEKKELPPKLLDILDQVLAKTETIGDLRKLSKIFNDMVKNGIPKLPEFQKSVSESNKEFVFSESRQRILREIKKPYVLPEIPKQKYKIKLSYTNRIINPDLMKKAEVPSSFKKAEDKMWGKHEKEHNERMSQERKNEVLDHLGGGDHFWEYMTETSRIKNKEIQYTNFGDNSEKVKGKIVRKEELNGDHLVFLQDGKTNKKNTILQSEINDLLAQEYMPAEFKIFFEDQNETEKYEKDTLFKRVSKRLKKEIDYLDKPAKNGYPNDPPPEMVNGMHPDLVDGKQIANRFNKLDPQSAKAMPLTGNPEIDKRVKKARTQPK